MHEYPRLLQAENDNDVVTRTRVDDANGRCRRGNPQPPNSPYTPNNHYFSFWRAVGGGCNGRTVSLTCKLPRELAPAGWNQDAPANTPVITYACRPDQQCSLFQAHNFVTAGPVTWAGCTSELTTGLTVVIGGVKRWLDLYRCPMSPGTTRHLDLYAETVDGLAVEWRLFSGVASDAGIIYTSPTFNYFNKIRWTGSNPYHQPALRFERSGGPATIRLYSLVA